jgi:2-polyprenyl-3-methyl-5-hydroxy-6-metoxy-1,4-benzoquinol methylase
MVDCTICNICSNPGRLEDFSEVKQIYSNVRKFQTQKFTVWRCNSCKSLHSKETIDSIYYYQYYPTIKEHKLDVWTRIAFQNRLKRLLREGLKAEHKILDFGCGKGLFVTFLHKKGYVNVEGYDPYVAKFSNEELLDKTYDYVISQDVIEHVDEPRALMEQMIRCLGPGRILCIGTPNAEHIGLSYPEKFSLSLDQPYHRHILSERALLQLGTAMGLRTRRTYYRWYYDTLYPTVNYRFLKTYIYRTGNMLDAAFEPPRIGMVLTSPLLWFYAIFGYLFPPRTEMMVIFQRSDLTKHI